jgi:hypothetical protein
MKKFILFAALAAALVFAPSTVRGQTVVDPQPSGMDIVDQDCEAQATQQGSQGPQGPAGPPGTTTVRYEYRVDKRTGNLVRTVAANPLGGQKGQNAMWNELHKAGVRSESYLTGKFDRRYESKKSEYNKNQYMLAQGPARRNDMDSTVWIAFAVVAFAAVCFVGSWMLMCSNNGGKVVAAQAVVQAKLNALPSTAQQLATATHRLPGDRYSISGCLGDGISFAASAEPANATPIIPPPAQIIILPGNIPIVNAPTQAILPGGAATPVAATP